MEQINLEKVASLVGTSLFELTLNLKLAQEQVTKLTEENQRLNQLLAEAKLGKE